MQNPREKRGSKWSKAVYFERILVRIVRVWAHLSSFSSNSCSKAVQNDHMPSRNGAQQDRNGVGDPDLIPPLPGLASDV